MNADFASMDAGTDNFKTIITHDRPARAIRKPGRERRKRRWGMVRIFLVRHGETAWNRDEVFRGRADIPLDENGRSQAGRASEFLRGEGLAAVYSSPLLRATETAKRIAMPHGLSVNKDQAFIDMDFGEWEGKSHGAVKSSYPLIYERWLGEPHRARIPGGETLAKVRKRGFTAFSRIAQKHRKDDSIAIISHRVVTKLLLCALLGIGNSRFWQIRQDTCCINLVELPGDGFIREETTAFRRWQRSVSERMETTGFSRWSFIVHYINMTGHLGMRAGTPLPPDF